MRRAILEAASLDPEAIKASLPADLRDRIVELMQLLTELETSSMPDSEKVNTEVDHFINVLSSFLQAVR
jgi:hypothetical protein